MATLLIQTQHINRNVSGRYMRVSIHTNAHRTRNCSCIYVLRVLEWWMTLTEHFLFYSLFSSLDFAISNMLRTEYFVHVSKHSQTRFGLRRLHAYSLEVLFMPFLAFSNASKTDCNAMKCNIDVLFSAWFSTICMFNHLGLLFFDINAHDAYGQPFVNAFLFCFMKTLEFDLLLNNRITLRAHYFQYCSCCLVFVQISAQLTNLVLRYTD